ncbi:hypothetical protein [Vannielia litorea]|uniref:hypothetical protein n=1 Tax=Vannielia litorea TaxID=1217970 RepID=UPI001BCF1F4B|nr:hypothetical protein [Vannielia litorea]MBS8227835.1 hypothetical protein [Vannielia litorea]
MTRRQNRRYLAIGLVCVGLAAATVVAMPHGHIIPLGLAPLVVLLTFALSLAALWFLFYLGLSPRLKQVISGGRDDLPGLEGLALFPSLED